MSALDGESVIGRKGRQTYEDAALAASQLGTFSRRALADELGVKPLAVGRFLAKLMDAGVVQLDDAGEYTWQAPPPPIVVGVTRAPNPAVAERRELLHRLRDAVRDLRRFTLNEVAAYLGVTRDELTPLLDDLPQYMVRDTGTFWRRAKLYEYAPPENGHGRFERRRYTSPEAEAVAEFIVPARGMGVAHGGCPTVSNNKDVQSLVDKAWRAGWPVRPPTRDGHAKILPPKGRPITVPSTPSSGGVRVLRDRLQEAGLNVKNRQQRKSGGRRGHSLTASA